MTVRENRVDVAANEEPIDDRASENAISNTVPHSRARVGRFERVLVDPRAIGTPNLLVDEAKGRIPFRDFRSPPDRNAADSEPVADPRAHAHLDRLRSHDAKTQPGGCQRFQVLRVGEEFEDCVPWVRKLDASLEFVGCHGADVVGARTLGRKWPRRGFGRHDVAFFGNVSDRIEQPAQKVLSSRGRGILFEIKELKCRRGASSSSFSDADIEQKTRPQAGMTFSKGC